jgi:Ca2+-binding RTX toxin-like protein
MAIKRLTANADVFFDDNLANAIYGLGGNDTIYGNGGNDFIDGGVGADIMRGNAGNDTYVVDNVRDITREAAGQGIDTVQASLNWTLSADVENLTLIGAANINGTGNALNNTITGNAGNNTLYGGLGYDIIVGGAGDDMIVVDGSGRVYGGIGADTIAVNTVHGVLAAYGGEGNDFIYSVYPQNSLVDGVFVFDGGDGNDLLRGTPSKDVLYGGNGNDRIQSGDEYDKLYGGAGDDVLEIYESGLFAEGGIYDGGDGIDTLRLGTGGTVNLATETVAGPLANAFFGIENLDGSIFADVLTGNALANVIQGGGATDLLTGGGGADRFVFSSVSDFVKLSGDTLDYDNIADFSSAQGDKIDISVLTGTYVFSGASAAGGGTRSVSANFSQPSGGWTINLDSDGNGTTDQTIFVHDTAHALNFTKVDFIL